MNESVAVEPEGRGFFYGWVMVIASFVIVAMGMGMVFSFGVFLKPLQGHFTWTRASISFSSTISWWAIGAFSLIFGFLSDRIGTRKVVITGAIVYGSGLLLSSRIEETWQLYITFGVMTGVGTGAFYVPLTASVAKWFEERQGVALAAVSAGNGIGVLILAPLSRFLINTVQWRWAFAILGLMVLGIVIPLSMLLRRAPKERQFDPLKEEDGFTDPLADFDAANSEINSEVYASLKTSTFWILTFAHFLGTTAFSGPVFHLVASATDAGIPKMVAATIFGFMGITSAICRIGTGHLADKVGSKKTLTAFLTFLALAIFSFIPARQTWSFYVAGVLFGASSGSILPLFAMILREYYGFKVIGTLYGLIFLVASIGIGIGPYFGGYIFDLTGSYFWLYVASGIISASAALVVSTLRRPAQEHLIEGTSKPALSG
jgi:MFS family permease